MYIILSSKDKILAVTSQIDYNSLQKLTHTHTTSYCCQIVGMVQHPALQSNQMKEFTGWSLREVIYITLAPGTLPFSLLFVCLLQNWKGITLYDITHVFYFQNLSVHTQNASPVTFMSKVARSCQACQVLCHWKSKGNMTFFPQCS